MGERPNDFNRLGLVLGVPRREFKFTAEGAAGGGDALPALPQATSNKTFNRWPITKKRPRSILDMVPPISTSL
jgi:hypothetical protein